MSYKWSQWAEQNEVPRDTNWRSSTAKIQDNLKNQCIQLKREKQQTEGNIFINTGTKSGAGKLNPNNNNDNSSNNNRKTERQELPTHPLRHVTKQTTPRKIASLEPMQRTDRIPKKKTDTAKQGPTKIHGKHFQPGCPGSGPICKLKT